MFGALYFFACFFTIVSQVRETTVGLACFSHWCCSCSLYGVGGGGELFWWLNTFQLLLPLHSSVRRVTGIHFYFPIKHFRLSHVFGQAHFLQCCVLKASTSSLNIHVEL